MFNEVLASETEGFTYEDSQASPISTIIPCKGTKSVKQKKRKKMDDYSSVLTVIVAAAEDNIPAVCSEIPANFKCPYCYFDHTDDKVSEMFRKNPRVNQNSTLYIAFKICVSCGTCPDDYKFSQTVKMHCDKGKKWVCPQCVIDFISTYMKGSKKEIELRIEDFVPALRNYDKKMADDSGVLNKDRLKVTVTNVI